MSGDIQLIGGLPLSLRLTCALTFGYAEGGTRCIDRSSLRSRRDCGLATGYRHSTWISRVSELFSESLPLRCLVFYAHFYFDGASSAVASSTYLDWFLYIVGANNPNNNQPYPNHAQLLMQLLKSSRQCSLLLNKTIRIVEIDPLNWPCVCLLEPSIYVRDDVDCLKVQRTYSVVKEMTVIGTPSL
jgi:hypothetical protein